MTSINVACNVSVKLFDADGVVKLSRETHNLVVDVGLAHIADQMLETPTQAQMGYLALGDDNTAPASDDTTLGNEIAREALDSLTRSDSTLTYARTWNPGDAALTVSEAGIFNDASAGVMLARSVFSEVTKLTGEGLAITWEVTFSDDGV